ncbi:MAG: DUF2029 domain-containing protein [Anaerolineales bacterium]|nr:DUF2029 domain-containing protein [Anaerolineales bacterium]
MSANPQTKLKTLLQAGIVIILLGACFVQLRNILPWLPDDFVQYYSVSQLLLAHQNPYDYEPLLAAQRSLGWTYEDPMMMWMPPWILPLVLPLSLTYYASIRTFWFFLEIAVMVISGADLWKYYAGSRQRGRLFSIISGVLTGAVIIMLLYGQINFLIIPGIVGFLVLSQNNSLKSDILAGMLAVLITIKPQVFYLFYPALLVWTLHSRRWGFLLGSGFSFTLGLLLAGLYYPDIISGYLSALLTYPPSHWMTPTLGYWLRHFLGFEKFWLQFVPTLPVLVWCAAYTYQKRSTWQWSQEIPLLILVSFATSAYTWTHDQVIYIIPFLYVAAAFFCINKIPAILILAACWHGSSIALFYGHFFLTDQYFAWIAPLMLLLFLPAKRYIQQNEATPDSQSQRMAGTAPEALPNV